MSPKTIISKIVWMLLGGWIFFAIGDIARDGLKHAVSYSPAVGMLVLLGGLALGIQIVCMAIASYCHDKWIVKWWEH